MKNYLKTLLWISILLQTSYIFGQDKNVQELYKAIQELNKDKVEKYAKKIGNLSNSNLNGEPPLNYLFYTYREYFPDKGIEIIEILVKYGANPNSVFLGAYNTKSYALESACHSGNPQAVKKLIDLGASVKNGYPLHIAAIWRREEVIKLLVEEYGVNVNSVDQKGDTPLICSVLYYDKSQISLPIVQYLIQKGSNKNATNSKGQTALDLAIKNDNYPVINYLKSLGVQQNTTFNYEKNNKKQKTCPRCGGTGNEEEPLKIYRDCNWCQGKGYKEVKDQVVGASQIVKFYQKNPCVNCKGSGKVFSHTEIQKCIQCKGNRYIDE